MSSDKARVQWENSDLLMDSVTAQRPPLPKMSLWRLKVLIIQALYLNKSKSRCKSRMSKFQEQVRKSCNKFRLPTLALKCLINTLLSHMLQFQYRSDQLTIEKSLRGNPLNLLCMNVLKIQWSVRERRVRSSSKVSIKIQFPKNLKNLRNNLWDRKKRLSKLTQAKIRMINMRTTLKIKM